jgi:epoxyqueuosine reductase QueG
VKTPPGLKEIVRRITETVSQYESDRGLAACRKAPLAAIVPAGAPGFGRLKQAVSPTHLLPEDILRGAKSVISFFIPFEDRIVDSNNVPGPASEAWALSYIQTNDLIAHIGADLEELLRSFGAESGKIPATHNFDESRLISDWSHRHIAWIASLGSFGMNNMLITEAGCCGRFGSLVTSCAFPPEEYAPSAPAPERCLYKLRRAGGDACGLCRERCPAGAWEGGRFDRRRCYARCLENSRLYQHLGYADVCGKCLAGLPCSTRDPSARPVPPRKTGLSAMTCVIVCHNV